MIKEDICNVNVCCLKRLYISSQLEKSVDNDKYVLATFCNIGKHFHDSHCDSFK